MRRVSFAASAVILASAAACSFLLDFDDLQQREPDAGLAGNAGLGGSDTGGAAGSNAGGSAGASGIPLDALAAALARAVCANLDACYKSAAELIIHDEDCETLFTKVLEQQTMVPLRASVARGTLSYDPAAGAACSAALIAGTKQDPPECSDFSAIIEDCKSALGGLAGADQPCLHRFECDKGLRCDNASGCPGTCRPLAQLGETCLVTGDCDPLQGLYCRKPSDADAGVADAGSELPGTCQPFAAIGDACVQGTDECVAGAICMSDRCQRVSNVFTLAAGVECYTNQLLCDPGLSCEFSGLPFNKLESAACVTPKAPGEPCKLALPGECETGSYCSANWFNGDGTCLALPTENQACAAAPEQALVLSAPCAATLACVDGLCKPMRDLARPCEADNQCYSGVCSNSVCVPPACPAE